MLIESLCPHDRIASMGIKRVVFRATNRALSEFGLQLNKVAVDFEQAPLNESIPKWLFRDFAACAETWLKNQECFEAVPFDTEAFVKDFYFSFLKSPFRGQSGGSRFNNSLWLALLARAFGPSLVIDSGTFQGASAWALKFGAPQAEVWSFDIDLSQIKWRTPGVEFREQDWTNFDFAAHPGHRTLVYFDDHLDQARRLLEAHERGVELAIFDDDFPVLPALAMSHGGNAFPKIEFVLSDELRHEKEVSWTSGGRTWRWPVDAAYLDRARDVIAVADRVPNTSSLTGIHQTPYRVVKIRRP